MKLKKIRFLLPVILWCATGAAAFYAGRQSTLPLNSNAATKTTGSTAANRQAANWRAVTTVSAQAQPNFDLQAALHGTGRIDRNLLRDWANSLDPSEYSSLVKDLQKLPAGDKRDEIIAQLVNSWSSRDPQGFLGARASITNPRARENGVADALHSLAETDPKLAIDWLNKAGDAVPNQMLARRYREAIDGMASNDPQAALNFVNSLGTTSAVDQQIRRQGLNTIADTFAQDGRYTDALQMFSSLPAQDRTSASDRLMNRWANDAPTDAAAYVANIADAGQRADMAASVAQSWARNDPQAAATWAAQMDEAIAQSTGQPSGQALADAMSVWSRYDLTGPAQFLNSLPKSPTTDQAIAAFTFQARSVDPSSAMNWANLITDPATRQRAVSAVALQWLATDKNGLLQAASANSNMFTDQQRQWLNVLSNNPQLLNRINQRVNQQGANGGGRGGFFGGGGGRGFGGTNNNGRGPGPQGS